MKKAEANLDRLLKARAEIDEQLRQHKSIVTVLFTDIVGSTSYFERFGDTAGLAMLHRHVELTREAVEQYQGTVIKTIGDSVMAEFPEPALAVHAAVETQRRQWRQNENIPEQEQTHLRVGVHAGLGFRYANDLYGDVVNVAARVTKHTGPAQILISGSVQEALKRDSTLHCRSLGRIALEGRTEKEEVFEVLWTDTDTYTGLRERVHAAVQRGDLVSPGLPMGEMLARRAEPTARAPVVTPAGENLDPRYEVLEEISRGGMGIVYKARDRETGELLALKVLKPEIAADPAIIERFKNELRLARKITHKNVCRIYDFHRSNGAAYISMELVEGESLRTVLNRFGGLPLRKALDLARQVAAALREAHSQGVVHRDLKPENVMVDPAGNVKVMDFGIALSMAMPASQTGTIVGTPAYMAPEQAEGRPVDARADLYSLGLLLYEMLTSKPAFTGDTPVSIALKQIREKPTPPRELDPAVPAEVEELILRCLEKDPARRFPSVDEFEAALDKGAPRRVPAAGAALARAKALLPGRFSRRDWLAIGSGVAVLVVAVLLAGRVFWPGQPPPADSPTAGQSEAAPPATTSQPPAETTAPADAKPSQAEPSGPPPAQPAAKEPARPEPKRTSPPSQPSAQPPAPRPSRAQPQETAAAPQETIFLLVQSFRSKDEADRLAAQLQESGFRTEIASKSRILWKSHDVRVGPFSSAERALAARNRLTELGYKDVRPVREGEE